MAEPASPHADSAFATTAWTQILAAQGRGRDSEQRAACLEHLAAAYWTPVYAYIRRGARSDDEALELTQSYFVLFLEKNFLDQADPAKGRFRAFLLASVKHFLLNAADYRNAARRAPKGRLLSLNIDAESASAVAANLPARNDAPDAVFMREWARAAVAQAMRRTRDTCAARGRPDLWRVLEFTASAGDGQTYESTARALGWSIEKVRKTLHRARGNFAESLRAVIRESVASDEEVDDELRDLRKYFSC